jgi:hypothetical protein
MNRNGPGFYVPEEGRLSGSLALLFIAEYFVIGIFS